MRKTLFTIAGFLLLGVAVFFGVKFFLDAYSPRNLTTEQLGRASIEVQEVSLDGGEVVNPDYASDVETNNSGDLVIDFVALQEINPDIYAWLEIPGTDISYPVVQHPDDDTYYLRRNSDREYSAGGAIFSEATYNSTDLNDPVTILYGHHMNAGNLMFGHLQNYFSDPEFLDSDPIIRLYTPEGTLEYAVFAAVPFNNQHILYYNNMQDPVLYDAFFSSLLTMRELGSYINEDYLPSDPETDRVLILSTCLEGNNTRRFLVMASLMSDF